LGRIVGVMGEGEKGDQARQPLRDIDASEGMSERKKATHPGLKWEKKCEEDGCGGRKVQRHMRKSNVPKSKTERKSKGKKKH